MPCCQKRIFCKVSVWLPNGKGYIENDGIIFPFKMVGPYAWAKQLYDKYKIVYTYPEYPVRGRGNNIFDDAEELDYIVKPWLLIKGSPDPLAQEDYYKDREKAQIDEKYDGRAS